MSLEKEMNELRSAIRALTDEIVEWRLAVKNAASLPATHHDDPIPLPGDGDPVVEAANDRNYTVDDVKAALVRLAEYDPNGPRQLLTEYGVARLSQLPKDQFGTILGHAETEISHYIREGMDETGVA